MTDQGKIQPEEMLATVTGYAIDPIESAIELVVRLLSDERAQLDELHGKGSEGGEACINRLGRHLDDLLELQLRKLHEVLDDVAPVVKPGDIEIYVRSERDAANLSEILKSGLRGATLASSAYGLSEVGAP